RAQLRSTRRAHARPGARGVAASPRPVASRAPHTRSFLNPGATSMDATLEYLRDLVDTHGVPGFEHEVAEGMAKRLKGYGTITKDGLGSFICEKKGPAGGPRVMLAGHLDEVGFMVKSITKDGFVKFLGLGGWWGHVVLGQRLIIRTRKGDVVGV